MDTELYATFLNSWGSLIGGDPVLGDLTNRWVIWTASGVYGYAAYVDKYTAEAFAQRICDVPYLILHVDATEHKINPCAYLNIVDESDVPNN